MLQSKILTGTWRPISLMLSMSSWTFWGSFALVRIRGLRILSNGSSKNTGPPCWVDEGTPVNNMIKALNASKNSNTRRVSRNESIYTIRWSRHGDASKNSRALEIKACHLEVQMKSFRSTLKLWYQIVTQLNIILPAHLA